MYTRPQGVLVATLYGWSTLSRRARILEHACARLSDAKPFLIHISDDVVVVVVGATTSSALASRRRAYEHNREKYGSASNREHARLRLREVYVHIVVSHTTHKSLYSQVSTLQFKRRLSLTTRVCARVHTTNPTPRVRTASSTARKARS